LCSHLRAFKRGIYSFGLFHLSKEPILFNALLSYSSKGRGGCNGVLLIRSRCWLLASNFTYLPISKACIPGKKFRAFHFGGGPKVKVVGVGGYN